MANTRSTTSSTSRKPRTAARSASRPATARKAVEPEVDEEVSAAEAQEIEAEGHYVAAELCGEEVQIVPPTAWRTSWQRLLQQGQIDEFAAKVFHPDDYELFLDLDPTMEEWVTFTEEASRQAGESLGKLAWTRAVVEGHAEAVEADLLRYYQGVDLLDVHRGAMSWRRLRVLIQHLPPESATWTALRNAMPDEELAAQADKGEPEKGRWSQLEQLMAANLDVSRGIEYVLICANTESKAKRPEVPKPTRRPGAKAPRPKSALSDAGANFLYELTRDRAA